MYNLPKIHRSNADKLHVTKLADALDAIENNYDAAADTEAKAIVKDSDFEVPHSHYEVILDLIRRHNKRCEELYTAACQDDQTLFDVITELTENFELLRQSVLSIADAAEDGASASGEVVNHLVECYSEMLCKGGTCSKEPCDVYQK